MRRVDAYPFLLVLGRCVLCNVTVKNREFWVSTVVDFVVSVAVGVAAAAVVAGVIALLAPTTTVALPVAIVATAVVGSGISMGVEAMGFPNAAKTWINSLLSQK